MEDLQAQVNELKLLMQRDPERYAALNTAVNDVSVERDAAVQPQEHAKATIRIEAVQAQVNELKLLIQRYAELKSLIAERDAAVNAANAERDAVNVALKKAGVVALEEYVTLLPIHNQTDSSEHTNPNYEMAKFTVLDTLPEVELPEGFWKSLSRYKLDRSYHSEFHVTVFNYQLIQTLIKGLGLDCKKAVLIVQNMDITPDLSIFFSKNFLPALNWEGKKGIGDNIFDNDSAVAGQVFEH
jgi:hypothetical protein